MPKEKSAESEEVTSAQQDVDNTEVVVALIQAHQPQPNRSGGAKAKPDDKGKKKRASASSTLLEQRETRTGSKMTLTADGSAATITNEMNHNTKTNLMP